MVKDKCRSVIYALGLRSLYAALARWRDTLRKIPARLHQRWVYAGIVRRIRAYPADRKIKVLFVVSCASKWKTQSLYERFCDSGRFEPLVVLSVESYLLGRNRDATLAELKSDRGFYESLGDRCAFGIDPETAEVKPLVGFEPDIVFFQSPGAATMDGHRVKDVMGQALVCYVPYSIETFEMISIHKFPWFHELLWLQDAPTVADAKYIRRQIPWYVRCGRIEGLGHTIFDEYAKYPESKLPRSERYVIYAPHFSFPIKKWRRYLEISTFLDNGREILVYAQAHPEIKWLFKPHPALRRELIEQGVWTQQEVEDYYKAWERLGATCYEGNYIRLFRDSAALVTDCSSFLVEYPLTGNPLIRLNNPNTNTKTRPCYMELFASFYNAHSLDEAVGLFDKVILQGNDCQRATRMASLADSGIGSSESMATNIVKYLSRRMGFKSSER